MLLCAGAGLLALPAFAAVETVTYGNFEVSFYGNGDVFSSNYWGNNQSSQDWTQEVKDCVGRALNYWSDVIVTDSTEKVKVAFVWQDLTSSGALGAASSVSYLDTGSGITYTNAEKVLRVREATGSFMSLHNGETSALVTLASNIDFYYAESTNGMKFEQYDLQSVLVHEIGHVMGFKSLCTSAGWRPVASSGGDTFLGVSTFDTLLVTKNENGELVKVFEPISFPSWSQWTTFQQTVEFSPGTEYFLKTGETAEGGLELSTLKVFNPDTWMTGSSMSHVEATGTGEEPQMSYAIANGKIRRELTSEELTLLKAMGWTVAVPEPSAFGLLAGTFALAFAVSRRRRRAA